MTHSASDIKVDLVVHGVELNPEQQDILERFVLGLVAPTGDGRRKREAGVKPHWRFEDGSHERHLSSHLQRLAVDPDEIDTDSGVSGWWHAMWRCGALAVQADDRRAARTTTRP